MSDPPPDIHDDHLSEDTSPKADSEEAFLAAAKNALEHDESTIPARASVSPPKTLGPYRIVSVLGRGGMGTVYEAEQQSPKRPVALKVVQGGRYVDEHYLRLFLREAQTLARLRHAGIAAIYEAGRTEDGQHYFAMELVRGTTLQAYVRRVTLDEHARLRLFCDICEAINYAHQRGVIHRDLKPSNILVDTEGHAKILDFGLARITDVDIAATNVVTSAGQIQGTIAYMSPEQARGNPDEIDLRSDVYSLGVILYELMTERRLYDLDHSVLYEAVRTVCEEAPVRPSTYNLKLRGDLETIILKTLEKDPTRRYHSAAALKDDIERFLTNHPILARPPSTLYQVRKLASRHKAGFAFIMTLFVVVVGFSIWTLKAERRARNEAVTATNVSNFLVGLFHQSDPDLGTGRKLTVREMLDEGAQQIELELRQNPQVRARLMTTMGLAYRDLGFYGKASSLLEHALRLRREEFGEDSLEVANGRLQLGWALRLKGDYAKAERLVTLALVMQRKLVGDDHPAVAQILDVLAAVRRDQGDYSKAEEHVRESLSIWRRVADDAQDEKKIATGLDTLSEILELQGKYREAEGSARKALEIRRRRYEPGHHYIASTLQVLAAGLRAQGRYRDAQVAAREALNIYRAAMGDDHPYSASAASLLGGILRDRKEFSHAGELLREADTKLRDWFKEDPSHLYIALIAKRLAWLHYETGENADAARLFREAIDIYRDRFGEEHPNIIDPLVGLGRTLCARGDAAKAEGLLRQALRISKKKLPEGHWLTVSAMSALGQCLAMLGRYADAEPFLINGYHGMTAVRGESDRYVLEARDHVMSLHKTLGKLKEAEHFLDLRQGRANPTRAGSKDH